MNDLGNAFDGTGAPAGMVADEVVAEIEAAGGTAVADHNSVLDGEAIVATALEAFGRLDVVVNNAGILTPESWNDLTMESWQRTIDINLTGVFSVCKAAWPVLVKQEYGRVVVTCSPAMYGSGVEAYAASKTGLIGLATSLQFEALKLKMDIKVNIVIPQADTRMTQDFAKAVEENRVKQGKPPREARAPDPSVAERMAPDRVSAMVAWLCHRDCQAAATVHEAGAGYFSQLRWQRSAPLFATEAEGVEGAPLPESIRDGLATLEDFEGGDFPKSGDGSMGAPSALDFVFRHLRAAL